MLSQLRSWHRDLTLNTYVRLPLRKPGVWGHHEGRYHLVVLTIECGSCFLCLSKENNVNFPAAHVTHQGRTALIRFQLGRKQTHYKNHIPSDSCAGSRNRHPEWKSGGGGNHPRTGEAGCELSRGSRRAQISCKATSRGDLKRSVPQHCPFLQRKEWC